MFSISLLHYFPTKVEGVTFLFYCSIEHMILRTPAGRLTQTILQHNLSYLMQILFERSTQDSSADDRKTAKVSFSVLFFFPCL